MLQESGKNKDDDQMTHLKQKKKQNKHLFNGKITNENSIENEEI